ASSFSGDAQEGQVAEPVAGQCGWTWVRAHSVMRAVVSQVEGCGGAGDSRCRFLAMLQNGGGSSAT
ncbi:hypothetical protein, partial [Amycolatopsis sp. NPDC052450]|uniref:hypothetical protein n=1 Tax=Amycolatopsis sp. NPDC052450 TaxID=3363937 RepID=UPI0037C7FA19